MKQPVGLCSIDPRSGALSAHAVALLHACDVYTWTGDHKELELSRSGTLPAHALVLMMCMCVCVWSCPVDVHCPVVIPCTLSSSCACDVCVCVYLDRRPPRPCSSVCSVCTHTSTTRISNRYNSSGRKHTSARASSTSLHSHW